MEESKKQAKKKALLDAKRKEFEAAERQNKIEK